MKNFKLTTILLVTLLAAAVFADSYARVSSRRSIKGTDYSIANPRAQKTVTFSGITSGTLRGQIRAGNHDFVITKDTRIYKAGEGALEVGTFIVDTPVYAVCIKKNNVAYAKLVIVSNRRSSGDGVAGTLDPDEPF